VAAFVRYADLISVHDLRIGVRVALCRSGSDSYKLLRRTNGKGPGRRAYRQ